MRPDELPFVVRRSRRILKESSSRRMMRLVPVLRRITNKLQMFTQVRPDGLRL